ncbi:hypothetical protein B0I35DRAFT_359830 [Stachybotrys elegans]|uniref:UAS domain-containing protein n=1 Tax=Stachybotrys elegans TaxID=80388 RepID=A0A8K0WLI4_9HYPO|nr:hypothetical protein B0I35DRAFT_359830 [Stachybotrys elegans]
MADDGVDVAQLSADQQEALQQYTQLTNQEISDAIPLLQRSQWNVQIAISKFFDGEGPDPVAEAMAQQNAPRAEARHENLQESLMASSLPSSRTTPRHRTDPAPRIVPHQPITQRTPWIIGLFLAPLGWGITAVSVLFRTVLWLMAFLPAPLRPQGIINALTLGLLNTSGRRMLMPRDSASRFKREFEEEYGPNEIPWFEGGLAQAHDLAKKDLKFMMVLLISPEHDDTEPFVRDTLLHPDVVNFIKNPSNNIIIWGGNTLDSEAYQVAAEYMCTKFPFTALVCLTPKEGSTRMGIVKRIVGPILPHAYLSEIQAAIERYGSDLDSVRAERTVQEAARNIRNEQDSAYERSLAIDRERARQRREAAAAAAEAERRAQEEAEAAERLAAKREQWKLWRASRLLPEPVAGDKSIVRVAIKMPEESGVGRIVRRFPQNAPMEELYAFVECYDITQRGDSTEDAEEPEDYEHKFLFTIASTLPRVVYEPSKTHTMMEKIGKSGNLLVESIVVDSDDDEVDD